MKKLDQYSTRETSLLTGQKNLEHLYTFRDFPVFMGCVDTPASEDLVADMIWDICRDTGLIQLRQLLPLEVLYLHQHNDGTGKVWQDHYASFAKFLHQYQPKNILEIGGAHDQIANNHHKLDPETVWTIVEPNPEQIDDPKIKVIKDWFDEKFSTTDHFDTIIHSHVFEHTYDPIAFIGHIAKFMKQGDRHIFTFPNLLPMLELKWTNCLNFEHTAFLTEDITDQLLEKSGFTILKKEYYGDPHSIFYATEKKERVSEVAPMENKYNSYKEIFLDYIDYHLKLVEKLNLLIDRSSAPIYLFGAHIFSQTLIQFGLKTDKIIAVLDNSPIKQGRRLYGTGLKVESPQILKDKGPVNVIVKVASYHDEITEQLLTINKEIKIW